MPTPADIAALAEARHPDPFAVLGPHADGSGGFTLRAYLPGALAVHLLTASDGKRLPLARHPALGGLFELSTRHPLAAGNYRLQADWPDDQSQEFADAYAFGALLPDDALAALADGSHVRPYLHLGAHALQLAGVDGVRFALWAPNAQRVSVVGPFNSWDGRRHPMRLRHHGGVWELFVPGLAHGTLYKYEIRTTHGEVLPLKADPYAFRAELRPADASVVAPLPAPAVLPSMRAAANARAAPISIYEVHASSWRREHGSFPDWDQLAATLPDYAADLGFTHLELLPVTEHPFDGSWGYQTLGMYAPTARFGDPAGLTRFIAACHARGLGVLLDWVPGHFPTDAGGLARFDGTALYEYADPREGFHRDWTTLIYNFARNEVRSFLTGSALYWLERWGFDGLRVDAVASMLYRDYSRREGEWIPNASGGRENLEAIALFKRINEVIGHELPGRVTVAEESTAFPAVSQPTYSGGLGFHYKWNMGWMHDTLDYISREPVHRKWHHHQMTFGMHYAYSENFILPLSHDEVVHGKRSLLCKMPGDRWQQFANLRAYLAYMWMHPGKKLLFMGGEFAQLREWNDQGQLDWDLLDQPEHRGVHTLVRDLNRLYRSRPALHRLDCVPGGFSWVLADLADESLYAWLRRDEHGAVLLVVANFTPVPRTDVRIGVPDSDGRPWSEVLNTDSGWYGGSNVGNLQGALGSDAWPMHGQPRSIRITVPPLATVVFEPAA